MGFEKMLWGISKTVNARASQTFAILFSIQENLLIGISGALGMKESLLCKQKYVLTKCCGVSQTHGEC